MSPTEAEVPLHKKNETSDQLEDGDLTDELLEWARAKRTAVSETTPDRMGPPQGTEFEPELDPPDSESMPSGVETAAPVKSKQQPKVLVLALDESAADGTRAHLFDDIQGARQFVETVVETGLNPDRIIIFRCTPMDFNVTCRVVVTIGEPEQQPAVSSQQA
jgi:hypothetical protein